MIMRTSLRRRWTRRCVLQVLNNQPGTILLCSTARRSKFFPTNFMIVVFLADPFPSSKERVLAIFGSAWLDDVLVKVAKGIVVEVLRVL
jgi:hypothetical protein